MSLITTSLNYCSSIVMLDVSLVANSDGRYIDSQFDTENIKKDS